MLPALLAAACLAAPPPPPAERPTRDGAVPFAERQGYFEKNTSGLSGPASFLWIPDMNGFEAVFQLAPPAVNRPARPLPLPEGLFETDGVVAVVRRGPAVVNFKPEFVGLAGGLLTVRYAAAEEKSNPGATFATPMILSVPRDRVSEVVFIENGTEVARVKAKPAQK